MSTLGELKVEYRVARIQVLALVERMNAILAEAGQEYRLRLDRTPHPPDDGDAPEDDESEDDESDTLPLDRPRGRIGSERGEREDESDPLPADDGAGA